MNIHIFIGQDIHFEIQQPRILAVSFPIREETTVRGDDIRSIGIHFIQRTQGIPRVKEAVIRRHKEANGTDSIEEFVNQSNQFLLGKFDSLEDMAFAGGMVPDCINRIVIDVVD